MYQRRNNANQEEKEEQPSQRWNAISDRFKVIENDRRRHQIFSQTRAHVDQTRLDFELYSGNHSPSPTERRLSPFSTANITLGLFFGFLTVIHWYPETWLLLGLGAFVWIATFWLRRMI